MQVACGTEFGHCCQVIESYVFKHFSFYSYCDMFQGVNLDCIS